MNNEQLLFNFGNYVTLGIMALRSSALDIMSWHLYMIPNSILKKNIAGSSLNITWLN